MAKDEIKANLEYQDREGSAGYDCWSIMVKERHVGYIYLQSNTGLVPKKLVLKDEIVNIGHIEY